MTEQLTDYYEKMSEETDKQSDRKLEEKEEELNEIFSKVQLPLKEVYKLAVLGCGDKRHLQGNTRVFEEALGAKVSNTTYDLDAKHLGEGAIQHDCTLPLPGKDFDITYGHVLLKFIPYEKQLDVIKNSYEALAKDGVVIHVIDDDNLKADESDKPEVPLADFEAYLKENKIEYQIIKLKYGIALVIKKSGD